MVEYRSYTRSEVYDLVWSKPVESLEDVFGMTGRAIAKRCDRFNIPVPIRGHWQKVAAGKRVQRRPLPLTPELHADIVVFDERDSQSRAERWGARRNGAPPDPATPRGRWEQQRDRVASNPAKQTAQSNRDASRLIGSSLGPYTTNGPGIPLSRSLEAGLRKRIASVMQLIVAELYQQRIKVWRERAGSIDITAEDLTRASATFRLVIGARTNRRDLTPEERSNRFNGSRTFTQTREPTGGLEFTISRPLGMTSDVPSKWEDGEKAELHRKLPEITASLLIALDMSREAHAQAAARLAEKMQREESRRQRQLREERLAGLRAKLLEEAGARRQATIIRNHVAAVETRARRGGLDATQDDLDAWSTWALSLADELDQPKMVTGFAALLRGLE